MSVIRELQEDLSQVETAQFVTTMLRDISATRLASIRAIFEANQAYYEELHGLMEAVKRYAIAEGIDLSPHEPVKGRIYVAVTANKRFYGNLNADIMTTWQRCMETDTEAAGVVIGLTGHQWLERHTVPGQIQCTQFASDEPTHADMVNMITALKPYTDVQVVHPTFINSFRQEPLVTDITHLATAEPEEAPPIQFICEPELPDLLQFFRTHIRLTLFRRALLETRLALTGARLMKMQRARERSVELVKEQQRVIHREMSTIQSMRLLETSISFHTDTKI